MKYLGLVLDGRWTFEDHFEELAHRLQRTGVELCRLLPNIGGPDERMHRLNAGVIRSMALYGAPVWAEELMARKKNRAKVASDWRPTGSCAATAEGSPVQDRRNMKSSRRRRG
ncbi:uncharacterized protein LOC143220473 [Lasioglossum baleicum]|uniref:uncharacterized protein LOC143220473 n=1 Tax=Lasioglossum baleicum TaxID=434251 RepID=UPI003FCEE5CA